ncbi:twin-arginine translocase subunit TatC [Aeromicrobium ponti]|jgi:sec-independent protein translocase protein TatC|uniref:Sec-independent protein translocase protein TatC n=1 Tax=Cytobacillus oceanisediminis TaxID=665099 RepID=A0A2V2ZE63_9BACI|nr:twin-arginine translocase subunit TatC [Cytobacillus oceanisediminis]PWW17647.1 sec-independent protein translocase protein TatC [Cytobacillus oceanisediminis]TWH78575.1 sec-independent protein translocase protein TatC [Cytobacillus oceanisediminis]
MSHNDMTIYEHIGELRKRIVISVIFFFIAVIFSFFLAEPLIVYLQKADEAKELTMNAFRLTDPVKIYMQFAFLIAFIITSPVILYQLWAFISPGLSDKERKVTLSYIPVSVILFVGGIAFAYFILFPFVVEFMTSIANRLDINQVIGINEYFQFLFQLTIPFGVLFQLPVVVMFLTRLGIVTPMYLVKIRKYAYFVLVVIAAFITPPDLLSHMMVTIPLLLLYEVSIFISRISYKKVLEAEKLQEIESEQS